MNIPFDLPAAIGSPAKANDVASAASKSDAAIAAEKFEGLMLSNLLKVAFADSGESMFGKGPGSHIYRGFMETYLADHLAQAGGLGLQDTLTLALGGDTQLPQQTPGPTDVVGGA